MWRTEPNSVLYTPGKRDVPSGIKGADRVGRLESTGLVLRLQFSRRHMQKKKPY